METLTLLVQVAILLATLRINHKLKMNQAELAQKLGDLGTELTATADQMVKALGEIRTAIENAGNVTPEVETALNSAMAVADRQKATAQELDDLNPDNP